MKKWPIETQILAGFVLAMALLSMMGALVYQSSRALVDSYAAAQRSQQALTALETIRSLVSRAEADQRLYYFTRDAADLAPRDDAFSGIERQLAQLEALVRDHPEAQALLPELESAIAERRGLLEWVLAGRREAGFDELGRRLVARPGRAETARIEQLIAGMQAAERARLEARQDAASLGAAWSRALVVLLLLLSLASVTMLYLRIRRDLHQQRNAREQLARQTEELRAGETRLRTVLNTVVDAIIVIDERGVIESFNPAAERILGYRADEVIGRNVSLLMPSPDREQHDGYLARYLAGGEPRIIGIGREVVAQRRDGSTFPIDLAVSEMRVGGRRMFTGIVRDITERKRAQERQTRLIEELKSANDELQNFAYVVSHDLKAPLRGIGSLAEWLSTDYRDRLDDEGQEHLRLLKNRVTRMDGLIEGILQYSRIGRIREAPAAVSIEAVVKNAIELVAPPPSVRVTVEGPLPVVTGEPTRIQQVFQNLLSNAIKYMDKPEGRVRIACRAREDTWEFSVADNGPGIEARHHDKIFQLFQTLAPRDRIESTGVGLALVKKIVKLYGGRVWLESQPGHGSTFYFTLPREPSHPRSLEKQAS